jgi:hypothetical protein
MLTNRAETLMLTIAATEKTTFEHHRAMLPEYRQSYADLLELLNEAKEDCPQYFAKKKTKKGHPPRLRSIYHAYEVDHLIPVSDGGTTTACNLQLLCIVCHDFKSAAATKRRAKESRDGND